MGIFAIFGLLLFAFPIIIVVVMILHGSRIRALERQIQSLINSKTLEQPVEKRQVVEPTQMAQTALPAQSPLVQEQNQKMAEAIMHPEATPQYEFPSTSAKAPEEHEEQNMGKILGRVGVVALLLGVSFFLKYAFDNNWIGEAGRVMMGLIAGIGMIGFGQVMRQKYLQYSDILIGGGMGILYLSIFSAFSFYHFIGSGTAFFFMAVVTALGLAISIANATMELSILSILGGFVTPFLLDYSGADIFTLLFYITILNLGILGVSLFKKWPQMVFLGFVGTAISYIAWYSDMDDQRALSGVLFFVLVNFLIFISATIARNIRAKLIAKYEDYFLLTANTTIFAGIAYDLLSSIYADSVLALCSVLMAVFYMALAVFANKSNGADRPLNFFLAGIGAVFLTLAVPLALDGSAITVAWLLEAVLIYITASMMSNRSFQVMGAIVYSIGALRFLMVDAFSIPVKEFVPLTNKSFALAVLLILVSYAIAFIYKRYGSITLEIQKNGVAVFVVLAHIFTIFTLSQQIIMYYDAQIAFIDSSTLERSLQNTSNTMVSIFWALYAIVLLLYGFIGRVAGPRRLGLVLFCITAVKVFIDLWSLGALYRIISSIAFGVIALGASFLYIKYKDRIKEVI